MAPPKIVLLACGSFNPPTNMHLRMFENAKDYLQRMGNMVVVGGIISPVHDAYKKKDLLPAKHRCKMVQLALEGNDWVRLSDWESLQSGWSRTVQVLQYHQNKLTSVLSNRQAHKKHHDEDLDEVDDIPQGVWSDNRLVDQMEGDSAVRLLLLCGADLLESFAVPNLWNDEDIETIVGQHGLVVITREGYNPYRFIYESDILTKHMGNIHVVTEWIANEVSSTKIRRAVRRGDSIKYLVPDVVENYIKTHCLYVGSVGIDRSVDDTDSGNVPTPRKVGRQTNRQEITLNEVNSKRSSSTGRQSRDGLPKNAPESRRHKRRRHR